MRPDLLSVLEAIYADADHERAWLKRVVDVAEPLLDRGFGLSAHTVERRQIVLSSFVAGAKGQATLKKMIPKGREATAHMRETPGMAARLVAAHPYADTFRRISRRGADVEKPVSDAWLRELSTMGIHDLVGVVGGNTDGCGALLFAPCPSVGRFTASDSETWGRVAAHLAAGYRLRRATVRTAEAVLEPGGRVTHSEPGVSPDDREKLAWGARSMDQARGRLRRVDPVRALSLWKGLVDGRWSLIDQLDHDGRRYVLARRNVPSVRPWRKLTHRETQVLEYAALGQSHKVIAYALGISVASVGGALASAASKVGARSRLELVAAYKAARPARRPTRSRTSQALASAP